MTSLTEPSYIKLLQENNLKEKANLLIDKLKQCDLCPRKCLVNRLNGETGYCGIGKNALVSSFTSHFGEEQPLVGKNGSGTIFFAGCNMKCVYCQNYDISWERKGKEVTKEELANIMLYLQEIACHNINLVTPSHVIPQWLDALIIAIEKGLKLPIVYNSGGYDSCETIKILDGVIDIYMPDIKYSCSETAYKLSGASEYVTYCFDAIREMHRQVGDLIINDNGLAIRGLLIRHLVLPNDYAGSEAILKFISEKISINTFINIMEQYRPIYKSKQIDGLDNFLSLKEYSSVLDKAKKFGLHRGSV